MAAKQFKFRSEARHRTWRGPRVVARDDGVAIAKEVKLRDPEENPGVKEAAGRAGDAVGDEPPTATLLAHAISPEGIKAAVDSVRALCRRVTGTREKAQVATISAHNNSIADAVSAAGNTEGREIEPDRVPAEVGVL